MFRGTLYKKKKITTEDGNVTTVLVDSTNSPVLLGQIPINTGSLPMDVQRPISGHKSGGTAVDGYFIIKGIDKAITMSKMNNPGRLRVKNIEQDGKKIQQVEIHSLSHINVHNGPKPFAIKIDPTDGKIYAHCHVFKKNRATEYPVPLFVLLQALGIQKSSEIVDIIVGNPNDNKMKNLIYPSMTDLDSTVFQTDDGESKRILSVEDALHELSHYMYRNIKIRNQGDMDDNDHKRIKMWYLKRELLTKELLPHMGENDDCLYEKAVFIAHMVNRLLLVVLNRAEQTNPDAPEEKHIRTSGEQFERAWVRFHIQKQMQELGNDLLRKYEDGEDALSKILCGY